MKDKETLGTVHTLWIMGKTIAYTIFHCTRMIVKSWFFTLTRKDMNVLIQKWSQSLLGILRISYTVHNPHHITFQPHQRYIMMVNHSSHYDIPLSFEIFPDQTLRMVAKKELFRIPMFGRAMRLAEIQSIDRNNRRQAIQDLQNAKAKMESGVIIWMAPEGTRSKDGKLGKLKKGGFTIAIEAQAIIIPIGIRGASKILPANTWEFHLNQHVDLYVGEPIDTRHYTLETKELLMEKVQQQLLELARIDLR